MSTVDIIMPAYNASRYIEIAVRSVMDQTFSDWQLVIIDDGSTDNTAEIVESLRPLLGSKLTFIRQENRGLPAARNAGIGGSSSPFIAILDSDDIWLPSRLEKSLALFADRPQVGLSYGLIARIDEHGSVFAIFEGNPGAASGRIAADIYMRKVELPCPTVTFRRKCVEQVGLFDESMRATEDRDLWLRIAQHYEVAFVPEVIAHYRTSPSSMSTDIDRMLRSQLKFIQKHYGTPGCGFIERQIAISRAYKQKGEGLKARKRPSEALLSALRACAVWPFSSDNLRSAGSLLWNWTRTR